MSGSALAVKGDGTVLAWGDNMYGQLGIGTNDGYYGTPIRVKGPGGSGYFSNAVAVTSGGDQTIALKGDGTVWAWGNNAYGVLGDGTCINSNTPVQTLFDAISGAGALDNYIKVAYNDNDANTFIADPVDSSSGAHVLERRLLSVKGAQPLSFTVHYNSLLLNKGPLGKGWGHDFETRLQTQADGSLKIYLPAQVTNGRGQQTVTQLGIGAFSIARGITTLPANSIKISYNSRYIYVVPPKGTNVEWAINGRNITLEVWSGNSLIKSYQVDMAIVGGGSALILNDFNSMAGSYNSLFGGGIK